MFTKMDPDIYTEQELKAFEKEVIDFFGRVQVIDGLALLDMGIEADYMAGGFRSREDAEHVCHEFPEFHVVSVMEDRYLNRSEPGAVRYLVGKGDNIPTLEVRKIPATRTGDRMILRELVEKYGTNPADPWDRISINYMRMLVAGDEWKDPHYFMQNIMKASS